MTFYDIRASLYPEPYTPRVSLFCDAACRPCCMLQTSSCHWSSWGTKLESSMIFTIERGSTETCCCRHVLSIQDRYLCCLGVSTLQYSRMYPVDSGTHLKSGLWSHLLTPCHMGCIMPIQQELMLKYSKGVFPLASSCSFSAHSSSMASLNAFSQSFFLNGIPAISYAVGRWYFLSSFLM